MLIDGQFDVAAASADVLAHLFDARLMASCLPGCESLEQSGDDRYRAVVAVALAGVKARFDLQVEVTERLADGVRATTRGEEGGNASTLQATSEVRLSPVAAAPAAPPVAAIQAPPRSWWARLVQWLRARLGHASPHQT